jgi:hypothetical protein
VVPYLVAGASGVQGKPEIMAAIMTTHQGPQEAFGQA